MNLLLFTIGIFVAVLLSLLLWSVTRKSAAGKSLSVSHDNLSFACKHLTNLPQIRQALEPADLVYIAGRSNRRAAKSVRQERRRVALLYLESLREDFNQLREVGQVVAALSPKVEAGQEWKRFWLTLGFKWKYQLVRARFAVGSPAFTSLGGLALIVSSLALDMEKAVTEIGEATVIPNDFSSPADR